MQLQIAIEFLVKSNNAREWESESGKNLGRLGWISF
jgi:hypothetical protein